MITFSCTPQYLRPLDGPKANIRIKTTNEYVYAMLHTYRDEGCRSPMAMGVLFGNKYVSEPLDQKKKIAFLTPIGMIGSKREMDRSIVEQIVPAEKPFTLLFTQAAVDGRVVETCKLPVTFVPKENLDYEIDFELDATTCTVTIDQLKSDGQGKIERVRVNDARKNENACIIF